MSRLTSTALCLGLLAGSLTVAPAMAQIPQGNIYFGLGTAPGRFKRPGHRSVRDWEFRQYAEIDRSVCRCRRQPDAYAAFWRGRANLVARRSGQLLRLELPADFLRFQRRVAAGEDQTFRARSAGRYRRSAGRLQRKSALFAISWRDARLSIRVGKFQPFPGHFAVAARLYVTPHMFVRPAVDAHSVNNFFQFGNNWVPQYSIGVGYSVGGE